VVDAIDRACSLLFTPGSSDREARRALPADADIRAADLEDAVADGESGRVRAVSSELFVGKAQRRSAAVREPCIHPRRVPLADDVCAPTSRLISLPAHGVQACAGAARGGLTVCRSLGDQEPAFRPQQTPDLVAQAHVAR
jgi:citrate lyase beta subunit